jgi:hypothetical protein
MRRVFSDETIPVRYRKTISRARESFKEVGKYMYISDSQNLVRPTQNFRVSISANTKKVQPAFHKYLCILQPPQDVSLFIFQQPPSPYPQPSLP